jgi:hypothetical protein
LLSEKQPQQNRKSEFLKLLPEKSNQSQELSHQKSKELSSISEYIATREIENQETVKKVTDSLDRVGIDDEYIFYWLFRRIFKSSIIVIDGSYHPDFSAQLKNIKQFCKLR